jgi:hypothetical protein
MPFEGFQEESILSKQKQIEGEVENRRLVLTEAPEFLPSVPLSLGFIDKLHIIVHYIYSAITVLFLLSYTFISFTHIGIELEVDLVHHLLQFSSPWTLSPSQGSSGSIQIPRAQRCTNSCKKSIVNIIYS